MASALVAITGANGTIGYHSVVYALQSGYRVRCVVRREEAVEQIKRGPSIRGFEDRVEYSIVPDNTAPGAYDDAFAGANYVIHIAGVWPKPNYHPDNEIWHPFVQSLQNVLSSSQKSSTVTRIVITQAGAGLVNPSIPSTPPGTSFTKLLNEHVKVDATTASFRPPLASPHHAYSGAKAYCMQYLQSLRNDPELPFSVAQVIPGTVIGPSELVATSADAVAGMDRMSRALLFSDNTPRYAFGFVSVRDCARVHVEALAAAAAAGDVPEFFVAAATTPDGVTAEEMWREVGERIAERFPREVEEGVFTIGRDRVPSEMPYRVDSTETARLLLGGEPIQGLLESVMEVAEWFVKLRESEVEA